MVDGEKPFSRILGAIAPKLKPAASTLPWQGVRKILSDTKPTHIQTYHQVFSK